MILFSFFYCTDLLKQQPITSIDLTMQCESLLCKCQSINVIATAIPSREQLLSSSSIRRFNFTVFSVVRFHLQRSHDEQRAADDSDEGRTVTEFRYVHENRRLKISQ